MTLDELDAYIEERDTIHRAGGALSDRERILLRTVKVMEEMGELSDEILAELGHQRAAKLDARAPDALSDELADTIITIFLLAKALKVNVSEALEKKMKKISERTATYPF